MKQHYTQSVSMICSTCGGTDFLIEQDDSPVRCANCDRVFSRDELTRENGVKIDSAVDDLKKEIMADIARDFHNIFKKFK